MKTFRKSASIEGRNARKTIAFRGGARNLSPKPSQSQHILSGRRLRRAARSGARIERFVVPEKGAAHRPTVTVDIHPFTRAILGCGSSSLRADREVAMNDADNDDGSKRDGGPDGNACDAAMRRRSTRRRAVHPHAYGRFLSIRASWPDLPIRRIADAIRTGCMPEWGRPPSYATVRRWAGHHAERAAMPASTDRDPVLLARRCGK